MKQISKFNFTCVSFFFLLWILENFKRHVCLVVYYIGQRCPKGLAAALSLSPWPTSRGLGPVASLCLCCAVAISTDSPLGPRRLCL